MTNITTTPHDYVKGQTVTFASQVVPGKTAGGYLSYHVFHAGSTAQVTSVRKNTIAVKVQKSQHGRLSWYTFNVPRGALHTPNGEVYVPGGSTTADKPRRRLGETPAGDHIAINDPRIAWIWQDTATAANNSRYCREYDNITSKLGIPGRLRDFSVSALVSGIRVNATIKARSQKEADESFVNKLKTPTVTTVAQPLIV